MTFVIVSETDCEPGKFLDSLAPDTRRRAVEIDARPQPPPVDPWREAACLMSEMAAVLNYLHQYARLEDTARLMVEHRLGAYEAWKRGRKA